MRGEEGIEGGDVASDDDIEPAHLWLGFEDEKICASVVACLSLCPPIRRRREGCAE